MADDPYVVRLPDDLRVALKRRAEKEERTEAQMLRHLLRAVLAVELLEAGPLEDAS